MMIGRADGPRLETSARGVRLIGFSSWPEPLVRRGANGLPLKPSYAERLERAAVLQGRHQRVVFVPWEDIERLTVDCRKNTGSRAVSWLRARRLSHVVMTLISLGSGPSNDFGSGLARYGDPFKDAPRYGVAWCELTSAAGTWILDAPLDADPARAGDPAARLLRLLDDPAARANLPREWPTGHFRPGLG